MGSPYFLKRQKLMPGFFKTKANLNLRSRIRLTITLITPEKINCKASIRVYKKVKGEENRKGQSNLRKIALKTRTKFLYKISLNKIFYG
tara:strand:+ start:34 stop:300 length:267 start_codon:yes stop_codon:yes gene_type:complete